jgi:hypothetical protein
MSRTDYSNLVELTDYPFPVYVSKGAETRAHQLAVRCRRAYFYFSKTLDSKPLVRLLILAPEHWQEYTGSLMFGVPQTIDEQTVVVAGQNAELWKIVVPPLDMLPPAHFGFMGTLKAPPNQKPCGACGLYDSKSQNSDYEKTHFAALPYLHYTCLRFQPTTGICR